MADLNFALAVLGAVATAGSANASYPASHTIDGSEVTYWRNVSNQPRWLKVDLGAPKYIESLALRPIPPSGQAYTTCLVEYSQDDTTFYALGTFALALGDNTFLTGGLTAQYWRVTPAGPSANYTVGAYTLEVIGPTDAPPPVEDPSCVAVQAWLDGLEANWVPCVAAWLADNP